MMGREVVIHIWRKRARYTSKPLHPDSEEHWHLANAYHYGIGPARYPVPALQTDTLYWRLPNGTPVQQLIAAWYLWRSYDRTYVTW